LGYVGAVTGEECTPCRGLLSHTQANGALVYPKKKKLEGTVLKAAWHWGINISVLND